MRCDEVEKYIEQYLAGDITEEERQALHAHLADCEKCAKKFREVLAYEAAVKDALQEVGRRFSSPRRTIMKKLSAETAQKRHIRRMFRWVLIWFLVVVAAGSLLTLYLFHRSLVQARQARIEKTQQEINQLMVALAEYQDENSSFPIGEEKDLLGVLSKRGQSGKPYFAFQPERIKDGRYVDIWASPYVYRSGGSRYTLYSYGPNRRDDNGADDDIVVHIETARPK